MHLFSQTRFSKQFTQVYVDTCDQRDRSAFTCMLQSSFLLQHTASGGKNPALDATLCEKGHLHFKIFYLFCAFLKKKKVKNVLYAKLELQPCGCMPPFTS